ncbi:MAG: hypothetical protein Q8K89_08005, partial [Actinomycetota bacterium]|nr:hypothetical protein [Actinomycetota bacterium]
GTVLTVLAFPTPIATIALIFVTFGDLMAKYAGLQHGRTRLMTRTLEGSLMYFLTCVGAGFAWSFVVPLPPAVYLTGALAAALTELAPLKLNDNLTVPLASGATMLLAQGLLR